MFIEHFYKNKNYRTFLLKGFFTLDATLKISIYEQNGKKMGKRFSTEFRDRIVQLHIDQGKAISWLAKEYGVSASTVSRWVIVYRNRAHTNAEKLSKGDYLCIVITENVIQGRTYGIV